MHRREPNAEPQASKAPDPGASQGWNIEDEDEQVDVDIQVCPPALSPVAGSAPLSLSGAAIEPVYQRGRWDVMHARPLGMLLFCPVHTRRGLGVEFSMGAVVLL